ncbi:hypothetical protein MCHUDSM44219_05707 [Mycolicibacterium chubuense]|uniref:Uncharacterized protein n=1 Tax=Mycolicibacterium chubuense TaxID=1800 RepID=A0A0J6VBA2_MYCCU|nr:hypothetical protein MCHUDSM44219_05707 [Mycolicibacterium chubuense]SPX95931.1 Uncharacterised protein [Mycolicibacterium chubuense]
MTRLNKQELWEWAYDDLLTNTTHEVLAEYIVATALARPLGMSSYKD